MKTALFISLICITCLAGINSYSKKADDFIPLQREPQNLTSASGAAGFKAKVEGADYIPDYAYALATFPGANGYYAIYGLDSKTNNLVAIALPTTAGEGTYTLRTTNFGIVTYNQVYYSTINSGSGTITITKKTATSITGTFSFTAYDASGTIKRTITDGTFNVIIR